MGRSLAGPLWDELKTRQDAVESALRTTLSRFTASAPPALADAMAYSLFAPGKRLRPLLAALACEAVGGTLEQSLPAGCAVEMIHTYSLIHDDLPAMDDDDLRRGMPTSHKKFGEALAILAGDGLLTMAFEVLASSYPPRTAAVSCVELASAAGATGMVGGQVLDLEGEKGGVADVGGLENIHRRKTGALFRGSLRLGVFAALGETGVPPTALDAIDRYATAFGLAFQVTDDLLDVESTEEKTGKKVGKDAARGKLTYPGLLGVGESRRKARELGEDAMAAANTFGAKGKLLAELAKSVAERDR
ncbi:polyprenyl synthetase family protein [Limnoglobus roseus]|uniref:Polyprenyl synthetase family protein n=1 Tax=Limnoglobus roseus TaxID=2598579 RepID=A0A5C1AB02_9BACT|nr:farnesyl diphosphate synthase [Limnoglobus roseus]QEL15397.1 polyprenyl synthetase family protein [Limnoglobus roseus]